MPDDGWWQRAHCVGRDPELWFPTPGDTITAERAKRICAGCPVQVECDTDARTDPATVGIWAGKRRFAPRSGHHVRDVQPCGTNAAYMRHLRDGETTCGPCRAANRIKTAEVAARRRRVEQMAHP